MPREQKIIDESQLCAQGLYTLKTRFHINIGNGIPEETCSFDEEALEYINCVVNQLSGDTRFSFIRTSKFWPSLIVLNF